MTTLTTAPAPTPPELQYNYYPKKHLVIFWNDFKGPLTPNILSKLVKIRTIVFGREFNSSIDELPDWIEFIKLNYKFQQKINKLPAKLIKMEFGSSYQHQICCNWPPHIKTINIEDNHHLIESLPPYLEKMIVGNKFLSKEQPPISLLPLNLKVLDICCIKIDNLDSVLPPTLEKLYINELYITSKDNHLETKFLPKTLVETKINIEKVIPFQDD